MYIHLSMHTYLSSIDGEVPIWHCYRGIYRLYRLHTYILMNKGERKWQGVISPNLFEDIGELQMLQ